MDVEINFSFTCSINKPKVEILLLEQEEPKIDLQLQKHNLAFVQKAKRKYPVVLVHQKRIKRSQTEKLIIHSQF
jgi:hypothetical protein